jgi:hypothetical protein
MLTPGVVHRKTFALAAASVMLGLAGCAAQIAAPPASPVGAATITAEDLFARIEFLASDALRGRDTPSPGLEAAAAYIVSEHRRTGLEPAGENGTYYQRYPYGLRRLSAERARLRITTATGAEDLVLGRDYFTAGATVGPVDAALVFVGRDIPQSAQGGSLRDRVAVTLLPGDGLSRDFRMLRAQQLERARTEGARAAIHVLDPSWSVERFAAGSRAAQQARRTLGAEAGFPQIFLSHSAARRLFAAGGLDLDALSSRALSGEMQPVSFSGITVNTELPEERLDDAMPPNVAAVIRGSDPLLRDEYVILSAHMDHVGVGTPVNGDSIYNGADDNASGTAGLLEVAQAFASLPVSERPRRSIMILHVSGEEKGLLGSRWFADNPTVPVEQIVANINVDMIGRNSPDSVVVIGKTYSTLGEVVDRVNASRPELRLVTSDDLWPEERFFFRSDHFNFARREIPSIFFFTGVHEDYHRPSDTVDKIDFDKTERISRLIFHVAYEIANDPRRPTWDPAGLEEVRALTR